MKSNFVCSHGHIEGFYCADCGRTIEAPDNADMSWKIRTTILFVVAASILPFAIVLLVHLMLKFSDYLQSALR